MIYHGDPICPIVDNGIGRTGRICMAYGTQVIYHGNSICPRVDNGIGQTGRIYMTLK